MTVPGSGKESKGLGVGMPSMCSLSGKKPVSPEEQLRPEDEDDGRGSRGPADVA